MTPPEISIVFAQDLAGGIGHRGGLPWPRLPADLENFRALTRGGSVIMGRRTWASLGARPLPGRRNVVLTARPDALARSGRDGPIACRTWDDATAAAREGDRPIFAIGGARIFCLALPHCRRIYRTVVQGVYPADVWFPFEVDWPVVHLVRRPPDDRNPVALRFEVLERRDPPC